MNTLTEQLEAILSETVEHARERERAAFDQVAGSFAQSIVLYGAGNLGRRVLHGLRKNGIEPIAFSDANAALAGQNIEGVPVFSPEEAVGKFGRNSIFVVCVWNPSRKFSVGHIIDNLLQLGASRAASFVVLFWKYSDTFLPYFFWDLPSRLLAQKEAVEHCYAELADTESNAFFVDNLKFRLFGDFRQPAQISNLPAYFPHRMFRLTDAECFVDCGAFDGDTIRTFLQECDGKFGSIVAFEPDPHNFAALKKNFASIVSPENQKRMRLHNAAVADSAGVLRFNATGLDSAAVTDNGNLEVRATTLDEALQHDTPTFIKMDIEGSERAALTGGRRKIQSAKPILAVSVYHRPEDLWTLPKFMAELDPGAKLYLRMYWHDGFDLVCFAVPQSRIVSH